MGSNLQRRVDLSSKTLVLLAALLAFVSLANGCGREFASPKKSVEAIEPSSEMDQGNGEEIVKDVAQEVGKEVPPNSTQEKAEPETELAKAIRRISEAGPMDVRTLMIYGELFYSEGDMKNAVKAYDRVLEIRPDIKPQLWQRGLALYYAEEYEKGVDQFDSHQTLNTQDVENSVWHLLCQSKLTSVEKARESMIQIKGDSRVPMKQVFAMFAGTGGPNEVLDACGYEEGTVRESSALYHGLIYVGLYHEMMGDPKASIDAMQKAVKCKPPMLGLMSHVAAAHLKLRGAEVDPEAEKSQQ